MKSKNPVAEGFSVRARRFLRKPVREKLNVLRTRTSLVWRSLRPVRLNLGFWWVPGNNNLTEPLLAGKFETEELLFADRFLRTGMTVLDVGAHHGVYSLLASRRLGRSGRVYAFEPSARERRLLRMHLILNACSNVTVEKWALGNENGARELFVVQGNQTGCNSLRPPVVSSGTSRARVNVIRLDDWIAQKKIGSVDFIKLDVEGGELAVLQGAKRLLMEMPRPTILAEVQDVRTEPWGYQARDILMHLYNRGYRWFRLLDGGELAHLDLSAKLFDGNFVAFPEERLDLARPLLHSGSHAAVS